MKNKSSSPYILPILLIPLILISSSCSPQSPVSSSSYTSARAHYSNGLILFQNDSLIEALGEYLNALKFNALGECMPFEKSTLLHELGYQYDKLQKYDTALYYYDEALSLMSDTSNISYQNLLFYIAMLDCTSGEDFDNGILKAKKLVSQTPEPHRDWRLSVYKTH